MMKTKHSDVCLVVNMSGGKDSVYMMGTLKARYPHVKMIAVMANTGFEHVKPVEATLWARARCEALGIPFYVVRNPNKTYLEMVERRGKFPSPKQRQCTSDLKRGPIQTWIRRAVKSGLIPEKRIINCMGLRAAESANRAKAKVFCKNKALSKAGRHVYDWLPIHKASLTDVLKWHWVSSTPLHPVYVPEYHADGTTGGYLRRLSCRLCIFATGADIQAIKQYDPDAFNAVASLEERLGFTMKNGESLVQIASKPLANAVQYGSGEEVADRPCM